MARTRMQAVAAANASLIYPARSCMQWVRIQYGVAALGDVDGDGVADAEDGWKASLGKHVGDRRPPVGVPVWWGNGSRDNGHVAIVVAYDGVVPLIRGTDMPNTGRIGTVPLSWVESHWNMPYVGWTEAVGTYVIPNDTPHVDLTRGRMVDRALRALRNAKAKGARNEKIQAAIEKLKSIKPFPKG